jgi:hypothetical protein
MDNKKNQPGRASFLGDDNGELSSTPKYTTPTDPLQDLLDQAAGRMKTDPARYDTHFMVWLSVFCLATGQRWQGVKNV